MNLVWQKELNEALAKLLAKDADIEAAAVVGLDGYVMAAELPSSCEEGRIGAISAAILSLGERAIKELGRGELAQVFVEGTNGYVFFLYVGEDAVLTAAVRRGSKLAVVLYDIRNTAKEIASIVEAHPQVRSE
ncbi:MAG: roadblock/LC7 domain-containing protein [Actinomycetota bacterium]|nr:roadblock/LC7 domain-containing protein [Actinomycetota bacterium]